MNIPVLHDDQYGAAIIILAGVINALEVTGKKKENVKIVLSGAGSAGQATAELLLQHGIKAENMIMVDTTGVIYKGREENVDKWKSRFAIDTDKRTLADAFEDADIAIGLSAGEIFSGKMV